MAKKLAFMTYGHLKEEFRHPVVQGFVDRVPGVYDSADNSKGFVPRSERGLSSLGHSWGPIIAPKCWCGEVTRRTASTLSLWDDIESVAAYAYHGAHGEAMKLRTDWFEHPGLPEHVAWWIEEGGAPSWQMAADAMDRLYELGPTPEAFSLHKTFGPDGEPYRLDTSVIKSKIGNRKHELHFFSFNVISRNSTVMSIPPWS